MYDNFDRSYFHKGKMDWTGEQGRTTMKILTLIVVIHKRCMFGDGLLFKRK